MKVRRAIEMSESGLAKRPAAINNEPAYAERMTGFEEDIYVCDVAYEWMQMSRADEYDDWEPYTDNAITRLSVLGDRLLREEGKGE